MVIIGEYTAELWALKQGSNYLTFSRPLLLFNIFFIYENPHISPSPPPLPENGGGVTLLCYYNHIWLP